MEVIAESKHVVVLKDGRIFYVKVFDSDGKILHPKIIQR